MVKKITFRKTNTLDENSEFHITFDPKVNIIIGPKGGGKSTLFDLLAGLKKNMLPKTVEEALAAYGLEFVSATTHSNETIKSNSLQKIDKKIKIELFTQRNDVIYQDDPIKKELSNFSEIEKERHAFAKKAIEESRVVDEFILKIKSLYDSLLKLKSFSSRNINWHNIFLISGSGKSKKDLIIKLRYDNYDFKSKLAYQGIFLKEQIRKNDEYIKDIKKINENNFEQDLITKDEMGEILNSIPSAITAINLFDDKLKKYFKKLQTIQKMTQSFEKGYNAIIETIKRKDFQTDGIRNFKVQAEAFFDDFAQEIIKCKKYFDQLVESDVTLKFNIVEEGANTKFLSYSLNKDIIFEEDEIMEILKVVLNSPGKSVNDIGKWLDAFVKSETKPFDVQKIKNSIARIIQNKIDVLANGQNYEHMSLGQKSIYGMTYKFIHSEEDSLFLDQPEDNLDNFTIATQVVDMISDRKEQVIIVTHNANIGILTNPSKVIVADLSNENILYTEGKIIPNSSDLDTAHFLEGGSSSLERRYKIIIKGEIYETKN